MVIVAMSLMPSESAWRVGVVVVVGGMTAVRLGRGLYAVRVWMSGVSHSVEGPALCRCGLKRVGAGRVVEASRTCSRAEVGR
jgi:hypothetical protein